MASMFGIGEQLFIGAVGLGDAQRRGGFLRLGKIARGDGVDGGVCAALHGGDDLLQPDGWRCSGRPSEAFSTWRDSRRQDWEC